MIDILFALVLLQPPVTTAQQFVWDQGASDLTTAQSYTYTLYLDGAATGAVLTPVSCVVKSPAVVGLFECSSAIPAITPGAHTATITARNIAAESAPSAALAFTFVAVPSAPQNVRIR